MKNLYFTFFLLFFFIEFNGQYSLDSLRSAYLVVGDYHNALLLTNTKLQKAEKEKDTILQTELLLDKAKCLSLSGEADSARKFYHKAAHFLPHLKPSPQIYFWSDDLYTAYAHYNDTATIRSLAKSIISTSLASSDSCLWLSAIIRMETLLHNSNNVVATFKKLNESKNLLDHCNYPSLNFQYQYGMATLAIHLKQYPIALRYYIYASQIADLTHDLQLQKKVVDKLSELSSAMKIFNAAEKYRFIADSLQNIIQVKKDKEVEAAFQYINKYLSLQKQSVLNDQQNKFRALMSEQEKSGFTRRIFLVALNIILLIFLAIYFFNSMKLRKKLLQSEKELSRINESYGQLHLQNTEMLSDSEVLLEDHKAKTEKILLLEGDIVALRQSMSKSGEEVAILFQRLKDFQVIFSEARNKLKEIFPNALIAVKNENLFSSCFYSAAQMSRLKPGKMFGERGSASMRGVGETRDIILIVGTTEEDTPAGALDNLLLQITATQFISEKKNKSLQLLFENFKQDIGKILTGRNYKFSVFKINSETLELEYYHEGLPVYILREEKILDLTSNNTESPSNLFQLTRIDYLCFAFDQGIEMGKAEDINITEKNFKIIKGASLKLPLADLSSEPEINSKKL